MRIGVPMTAIRKRPIALRKRCWPTSGSSRALAQGHQAIERVAFPMGGPTNKLETYARKGRVPAPSGPARRAPSACSILKNRSATGALGRADHAAVERSASYSEFGAP